jgi:hypothetical protein
MRGFFDGMPWSLWWFVLTAFVYALQLFPPSGIFLMLLMAPFWSIFTINLGFITVILEVVFGRVPVSWLLLPGLWFGGYFATAYLSHSHVATLDAQIRAINAAERIPFDPAKQALVLVPSQNILSHTADNIVREYRIPVAYTMQRDPKGLDHRATRLMANPQCQTIRQDQRYTMARVFAQPIYEEAVEKYRRIPSNICSVSMPEDPVLPTLRVEGKQEKHDDHITPYVLTRMSVYNAEGTLLAQPVSGHANPLSWLPMPILGCGLNSGAAKWQCMTMFWRGNVGLGGRKSYGSAADEVIPEVLGLARASSLARREEIAAVQVSLVTALVDKSARDALSAIDAVIADPTKQIIIHDVSAVRANLALLGDRAPAIVEAIARSLANGRRTYETARVLQDLLAHLPATEFDAVSGALLATLNAQSLLNEATVAGSLANRLGQLGPTALPVLEQLVFSTPKRPVTGAFYGLCRIGAAAAHRAELIAELASDGLHRERDTAIYVALRRMGRDDIIARERATGTRFKNIDTRLDERTIAPDSPPNVCTDERGFPRLPS